MEPDQPCHVDVRDAVAVGEAVVLVVEVFEHALEPAGGLRLRAGVDKRDAPRLRGRLVHLHRVLRDVERDVGGVEVVVGEVLLDHVPEVAEADHEVVQPVGGVDLHDVPEDRLAADLDHRLRAQRRLLAEARSYSACQDDDFHVHILPAKGGWYACIQCPFGH